MIDIHSHLIFEVDDGPVTVEESMRMLQKAEKAGVRVLFATPHFHESLLRNGRVLENYQEVLRRSSNFGVDIRLGYEVSINSIASDIVQYGKCLTLGNSGYILLELPFSMIPVYSCDVIYRLQLANITVIIAHPERNRNFLKNIDLLTEFAERGCMLQIDAASVVGVYGRHVKDFVKKLIQLDLVSFISSDAHYADNYTDWYMTAYKKVEEWAGEDYAGRVFGRNAEMIAESAGSNFPASFPEGLNGNGVHSSCRGRA